jgi:hypothetical protein
VPVVAQGCRSHWGWGNGAGVLGCAELQSGGETRESRAAEEPLPGSSVAVCRGAAAEARMPAVPDSDGLEEPMRVRTGRLYQAWGALAVAAVGSSAAGGQQYRRCW